MGNEVSNSEVEEEQEGPVKENNPEFAFEVQNGPVTLQSSPALNSAPKTNHVSSKEVVQQENVITSSQKTIVFSPISNGSVTTPPPPAAKSKFRLTISRPSPGRTMFQPNGKGDVGPMKQEITLQESPVVQTQLMTPIGPDSMVVKDNVGGVQNQAPPPVLLAEDASFSSTNPKEDEEPSTKPKEVSFFDKLFKSEKKMQPSVQTEVTIHEPVVIDVDQTAVLQSSPPSGDLQSQSVDDYDQATSAQEQSSTSEDTQNTPPAELHPVMSFFKTLVTPNKSVTKSEEEAKTEGEDKKRENGGFRKASSKKEKHKSSVQQTSEAEAKNLKKSESPKSGTLSRLFKQKSKKDEQQTSVGNVILEQSVVSVSVNSEKSSPDQVLILDPKTSDVPKQIIASEEQGKAAKESAVSRPKLFWRKSSSEPEPQSSKSNTGDKGATPGSKSPENKKQEDGKSAKPKIMMFFKQLTLDITDGVEVSKNEKTVVTAVVEPPPPPPQKGKDNVKEKKASAEKLNKQESRESAEATVSVQLQAPDQVQVDERAGASREWQLKRTEKRQSLGNFFKAIGPKRMCDAEVQTDPVTILPAEKTK